MSKVTALTVPASKYEWFTYTGKTFTAENRTGREFTVTKGEDFGVRRNEKGTRLHMVIAKMGLYKPFTIDAAFAEHMGKNCVNKDLKDVKYTYDNGDHPRKNAAPAPAKKK